MHVRAPCVSAYDLPYHGFSGYRIYGIFGGKINGTLDTPIRTDIEHESCLFLKDLHVTTFRSNFVPLTGPGF